MARQRSLTPSIWRDEKLSRLDPIIRMFFIGLISNADDEGRLFGNSKFLASLIFPCDEEITSKITENWTQVLSRLNIIRVYEINNIRYIQINNFTRHQAINRPSISKIPQYREQCDVYRGVAENLSENITNELSDTNSKNVHRILIYKTAKKRTLNPRIWSDEKLNCVEPLVRLLFIGLFSNADDDGQICGDEEFLAQLIFYRNHDITSDTIKNWLGKLATLDLIKFYETNNVKCIQVKNFSAYQTIRKNPMSKLPNKVITAQCVNDHVSAHERSRIDTGTLTSQCMNDHALGKNIERNSPKPTSEAVIAQCMNDHALTHERSRIDAGTLTSQYMNDHALGKNIERNSPKPTSEAVIAQCMNDHALGKNSFRSARKAIFDNEFSDSSGLSEKSPTIYLRVIEEINTKALEETNTKALEETNTKALEEINTKALEEINTKALEEINTKALDYISSFDNATFGLAKKKTKTPEKINGYENENLEQIFKLYNELCVSLPKAIQLSDKRKKQIKALIKNFSTEDVGAVFRKTNASDFLSGRNGKWTACNIDWLINPSNFLKVLEGKYDNRSSSVAKMPKAYAGLYEFAMEEERRNII